MSLSAVRVAFFFLLIFLTVTTNLDILNYFWSRFSLVSKAQPLTSVESFQLTI